HSASLLNQAVATDVGRLPDLLPQITPYLPRLRPRLEAIEGDAKAPGRDREMARLMLYRIAPSTERARGLASRPPLAAPELASVLGDTLATSPPAPVIAELWDDLRQERIAGGRRLRAAVALAALGPRDLPEWDRSAPDLARALLAEERRTIPRWV